MQEILGFIKLLATSNTVNFIIMLLILFYIIKKANLGEAFEEGVSKVESDIKKSDEAKYNSQKQLNQARYLIERLPQDIEDLKQNNKQKIEIFNDKIKKETDNSIDKVIKNISGAVGIEEKRLSNMLIRQTTKSSVEKAKGEIISMLNSNPKLYDKFVQNSIEELDKVAL